MNWRFACSDGFFVMAQRACGQIAETYINTIGGLRSVAFLRP
jgi:hypothetical protein